MPSAHVQLSAQLASFLAAAPPIADEVVRDREHPVPKGMGSLINVRLVSSKATRFDVHGGPVDWLTVYGIECFARHAANVVASDAVDPVLSGAYERLAGEGAATGLGVEDLMPDPDITWDAEEGEEPMASAFFTVSIVHRTEAVTLAPRN